MNSDQFWSVIGKILALVGGIAAFIKIIEWVSSPRQKLVASVESVPFELPESKGVLEKFTAFHSMWIVKIQNNGTKSCEGVNLVLPNAAMVCISRAGVADEYRKLTDGVISLGTLNPLDVIHLKAWSGFGLYSSDPTEAKLAHNAGVGVIRARASAPKIFHDLEFFLPVFKFIAIGCVVGLLAAYFIGSCIIMSVGKNSKSENQSGASNSVPTISSQSTNATHP